MAETSLTLSNLAQLARERDAQRFGSTGRIRRGFAKSATLDDVGEVDTARDAAPRGFAINLPKDLLREAGARDFRAHDGSASYTRRNDSAGVRAVYIANAVYSGACR